MPSLKVPYLLVFGLLLGLLPVQAQIHGIAPSVTSYGFGGNFNPAPGPRASVTSLGPFGYSFSQPVNGRCCFNAFGQPYSPFPKDQTVFGLHHHRHFGPSFTPGYAGFIAYPYPYPVAVPEGYAGDQSDDEYASDDPAPMDRRHIQPKKLDPADEDDSIVSQPESGSIGATVSAQPTTTLVFKDGRKLDVENYAIVGETLFEFSNGLTHKFQLADLDLPATQKLNDDRGVEFHAPANGAQ